MQVDRQEAKRQASQIAFGQRYRLELMLAVLRSEDGLFSLSGVARELGVTASNLQGPIESLLNLGLINRLPADESGAVYYLRNESAAWAWVQELNSTLGD